VELRLTNHQNGNINEKYEIREVAGGDFIKDGKYEKWFENGNKECEGEYIENRKFGYWKFWHVNGELKEDGEYFNDEKGSDWKIYPFLISDVNAGVKRDDFNRISTKHLPSNISDNQTSKNEKEIAAGKQDSSSTLYSHKTNPSETLQKTSPNIFKVPKTIIPAAMNYKSLHIALVGMGLLMIAVALYVFVFKSDRNKELKENNLPSKQEDTKMHELKPKEKESEGKVADDKKLQSNISENKQTKINAESKIRSKLTELIKETNAKNSGIRKYYANEVYYYKGGKMHIDKIMKDKNNFFNKWEKIELSIDNVNITEESEYKYSCLYDKYFLAENFTFPKSYSGKVRSKLVFELINDDWLITEETDGNVYYSDKK